MITDIPQLMGQENMEDLFSRSLETGRIPHALIIAGVKDSGKLEIARAFAMKVLKTKDENNKDIRIIEFPKTTPKYVETVRELIVNDMQLIPLGAEHKFYIIKDAETMTPQAQNSLLKSIEEPPEYAHVIFLAEDAGKLLPTIRSRALYLCMKPVEFSKIEEYLVSRGTEKSLAAICASLSMGNLMKAVEYSNSPEDVQFAEEICEIFTRVALGEKPYIYYYGQLQRAKADYEKFTELMEIFLRDVLLYKLAENSRDVISPWKDNIKRISAKCSFDRLGAINRALSNLKSAKVLNSGVDNLFDILFTEIGGSI